MMIENEDDRLKAERLYFDYRDLVFYIANGILHDDALSEDAVQETFVRVMNNLHKIDESDREKTKGFLAKICENVAKDMFKARNKLGFASDELDTALDERAFCNPERLAVGRDDFARMVEAIEKLDPKYRDVFLMKRVHNLSREEIALSFNLSVETVKKRITRAKVMVVEYMQGEAVRK